MPAAARTARKINLRPTPGKPWLGRAAAAAAVLAVVVVLHVLRVDPVPVWFYVFAWYPTLALVDLAVVRLGGDSLLGRPRRLAATLWWSAVIWFAFEALNFRMRTWYYVYLPDGLLERWVGISLGFATVIPAILLPTRLLERLELGNRLITRPLRVRPLDLRFSQVAGVGALGLALAVPHIFHPLVWGAVWLLAEPALYRRDPTVSLFGDLARGRWDRIVRLLTAGAAAGLVWEGYNAAARAGWVYTVPFLEEWKLFEMPVVGFLGFPFLALEVWTLYHLLLPLTRPAIVAMGTVLSLVVLAGMDRWTVTSTTPRVAELPGVGTEAAAALEAAGLDDVFHLADLPTGDLAQRAGLDRDRAASVSDAARVAALRGIGTTHATRLFAHGIRSIEALAAADPDTLAARLAGPPRPTPAEVRVWVRAAQYSAPRHARRD